MYGVIKKPQQQQLAQWMVQDDLDANQFVDGHQHTKDDILIMVEVAVVKVVIVVVVFWNTLIGHVQQLYPI